MREPTLPPNVTNGPNGEHLRSWCPRCAATLGKLELFRLADEDTPADELVCRALDALEAASKAIALCPRHAVELQNDVAGRFVALGAVLAQDGGAA